MEVYFGGAEDLEISQEEMSAIRAMVMAVSAGRIFFQSKKVVERMGTGSSEKDGDSGCSPGCFE